MSIQFKHSILVVLSSLILVSCATHSPESIRDIPEGNLSVSDVRANTSAYIDSTVRWGGIIVSVQNKTNDTWVEIISRELHRSGRPHNNDFSSGRFIAIVPEFLDPSVFKVGREMTFNGRIQTSINAKIGAYDYLYPVISADDYYLWKPVYRTTYRPRYYYHDPFYRHRLFRSRLKYRYRY